MGKLGILTFHWADDFGAMLQTYGLKCYLQGLGHEVEVVPYSNTALEGRYYFLPKQVAATNRKYFIGDVNIMEMLRNLKHFKRFREKRRNMKYFRKRYLTDRKNRSNPGKLGTEVLDILVVGSDQVWNPELTIGLDPVYMGSVPLREGARVISYGASFGSEGLTEEEGKELGNLLERKFTAISLREKSAIPFLRRFVNRDIVAVPDPTILAHRRVWDTLLQEKKRGMLKTLPGKYIVYQSTEYNETMLKYAEELGKLLGEPVYDVRRMPNGPIQFLQMMAGAHYVVTNSFHGTVFAVLFEKQFVTFAHSDKNARLRDLLMEIGLEDRLAKSHELSGIERPICWERVRSRVEAFKGTGEAFLQFYLGES